MPEELQESRTPGTLDDLAHRILGQACACYGEAWPASTCEDVKREVVALLEEAEHRPPPVIRVYVDGIVMVHGKPISIRDLESLISKESLK